ncbi:helix-turn-helix transcriptional regulator [Oryzomonas sagensis]|uniref:Helix-turn-helix transcriptional regulator n=1 Tax=Oryzomonas sagensis TaxID=2603857 RepID=A0ABQ6TN93_9BACT|nr:helix-turn-helix transcriptional regulator [Oryzomonas sagensis]KAB0670096.1 helix-turn-helix transcriptional regulator [Oryzomonas sagensis]
MKLGRLIKSLRISFGWQQKDLAEKLDISTNYLCQIETGKKVPSADIVERVAGQFNISKDALNFLSTDIPGELDPENAINYRKLQENVASLLLFQSGKAA